MPPPHPRLIDLPQHAKDGGFDHAAVHEATGRIYVAHTANDAVDVIDIETRNLVGSIGGLPAVAGAQVAEPDLVFTSNRGENTVGIFRAVDAPRVERIPVGVRPNGLAHDGHRGRLLAAHVGDPAIPGSCTVSVVDVEGRKRVADIPVAGLSRWRLAIRWASVASSRSLMLGPTAWTSMSSDVGCSVPAMPGCSSKSRRIVARCWPPSASPAFRTSSSSTRRFTDSMSPSVTRA